MIPPRYIKNFSHSYPILISDNHLYIILGYSDFVKYGFIFIIFLKCIWCYERVGSVKNSTDGRLYILIRNAL